MDRRFQSDKNAFFISPVVNIREFRDEALAVVDQTRSTLLIDSDRLNTSGNSGSQAPGTSAAHDAPFRALMPEALEEEELLNASATIASFPDSFADFVGCTDECAAEIFEDFDDLSRLRGEHQPRGFESLNTLSNMRPEVLKTHEFSVERDRLLDNFQKRSNYNRTLKYDFYEKVNMPISSTFEMVEPPRRDIMLTVTLIRPHNRIIEPGETRHGRMTKPESKFDVLGETTLLSLRRKLICVSDFVMPSIPGHELDPPNTNEAHYLKFPSAFIFIHDTFYVDYTVAGAQDISEPIRNFMKQKKIFDPVKSVNIEGVKIVDLILRLGQPYVFVHSGFCEHLLVFHDLRLTSPADPVDGFPRLVYVKTSQKKCEGCKRLPATMLVVESDALPHTPGYLCDECFRLFFFPNGERQGDFVAHHYFQKGHIS